MDSWIQIVSNVGFPIAVAAFVIYRIEPALKEMNNSLVLLVAYMSRNEKIGTDDVIRLYEKVKEK